MNKKTSDWPKAVLFDLDGTLIDSAPDIAAAVNEVMDGDNLPALSVDQVRAMIGNGIGKLVERAYRANGVPLMGAPLDEAVKKMMSVYGRHLTNLTLVLPGAAEAIAGLARAGVKTAIVSNKPHGFTEEIARAYGFAEHLTVIQGAEDHLPKKPAPDMLFAAIEKMGAKPEDTIFVGDSIADVEAAKNAKLPIILVHGGYSNTPLGELGADAIVETLMQLLEGLEKLRQKAPQSVLA